MIDSPDFSQVPVTQINDARLLRRDVQLRLFRLDLVDRVLGGNKWFKLYQNLTQARQAGATTLLSFGGAWSNHLCALAEAGQRYGFRTIGIIRGELPDSLNPALQFVISRGMHLVPVSRTDYRQRHDPVFIKQLLDQHGPAWVIPEGGANLAGVEGCQRLASLLLEQVADLAGSEICLACGTATTLAGLVAGLQSSSLSPAIKVTGHVVLKGGEPLTAEVAGWLQQLGADPHDANWCLDTQDAHFGGYAKQPQSLLDFIADFSEQHDVPLEPVYSGRLLAAIFTRLERGDYPPGTRLLALHTGGLLAANVPRSTD
ncbi:pyridoxal-phosphate dependent enzyme [Pseudohongiella sp. SYSU M77423]|uniref:1-aminocyclopropane-1-carboxylate deaminase/D-cysteine desulfhydrase n=1 Tax=Pseudohongiella sp. SYSU M77423 TaxID=3042312 RepID=UPI002480AF8B|nr:pyridoxal-phosphate dependent enzyme [Pseudohongiella sp. SYSU M77423]MDH7945133.1 pyridoxal-phosphate dependent enzyme [Pseudohongiella sp. SYSU M77423]